MNLMFMIFLSTLILIIMMLFYLVSKIENWSSLNSSSFECGFSSYFYSRFSFSIHYFLIGLIFLFLDLELCFLMPFLTESMSNLMLKNNFYIFILLLICSLVYEWSEGKMNWAF